MGVSTLLGNLLVASPFPMELNLEIYTRFWGVGSGFSVEVIGSKFPARRLAVDSPFPMELNLEIYTRSEMF